MTKTKKDKVRTQSQSSEVKNTSTPPVTKQSICSLCNEIVNDITDATIECDKCKIWSHISCYGITEKDSTTISQLENKGVRWFCKLCVQTDTTNIEKIVLDLQAQVNNITTLLFKQNEQIESNKTLYSDIVQANNNLIKQNITTQDNTKKILEQQSHQLEIEKRKVNAVLYNIPEHEDLSIKEQLISYFDKISYDHTKILSVQRLGKIDTNKRTDNADNVRSRPIKIRFPTEHDKWELIKRVNSQKLESVFATLDLTKEERDQEYNLRCKKREILKSDPNRKLVIKNKHLYQIDGLNWTKIE